MGVSQNGWLISWNLIRIYTVFAIFMILTGYMSMYIIPSVMEELPIVTDERQQQKMTQKHYVDYSQLLGSLLVTIIDNIPKAL